MLVEKLANYRPWYYKGMHNPGDTRIILGDVSDTQKHELEQLMDAMFVRNELLSENLRLSHEPDSAVKSWIRQFLPFGHHFFSEPGLKKTKKDDEAGGCTIVYESGRSGNPYEAIRLSSDYYGAHMRIGPVDGYQILADGVHIFVQLHRVDYGDILIREIFERHNPDVSRELEVAKKVFGNYTETDMGAGLPQVLVRLSPRLWDLLDQFESDDIQSALKECASMGREDVDTLICIANDGESKGWYGRECCPVNTQIAAIRALAETGDSVAKDYLESMLDVQTIQAGEESDPGDMYNMGGGSAWEEYTPALYVTAPNVRGHLLSSLCGAGIETSHSANGKVSGLLYEIKEGEALRVIRQAQQRINETVVSK